MKREWPPPFESDGAAYVFDTRSGFFYEATSDFFYDPKTKLYYGNKQRTYFQFVEGEKPPFRPFNPSTDSKTTENDAEDPSKTDPSKPSADQASNTSTPSTQAPEKKKIAISLKTKKVGSVTPKVPRPSSPTKKSEPTLDAPTPTNQKKRESDINIEKWSGRARENKLTTITTQGKPVCLLCKRKFATQEKLQQHINLSSLHKRNLEKLEETSSDSPQNYRDRARERRDMFSHEPPSKEIADSSIPSLSQARVVTQTETEALGSNIGNVMLQKLAGKSSSAPSVGGNKNEQLRQDWNTIEQIACRGNGVQTSIAGVGK